MIAKFIEDLRTEFDKQPESETGWGRNDIKADFEIAVSTALANNAPMTNRCVYPGHSCLVCTNVSIPINQRWQPRCPVDICTRELYSLNR
jgi:hypothetical protein